jgi:histidinol-phosphate aminotransferase
MLKELETEFPLLMKVFITHTNFVLVSFKNADEVYRDLKSFGISVRFMGKYLRITAGTEAENRELISSLRIILDKESK